MKLSTNNLHELCNYALTAAKSAGDVIRHFLEEEIDVQYKAGGQSLASQVVTKVDLLSQNVLLETIESTLKKYDLALLTEELPDDGSRFTNDYFWCIDPLDGTLPFIEKKSGFSVSIALVSKSGKPIIGVIYDPILQNTYHAIMGNGAFKNGEPWAIMKTPPNFSQPFTFISDRSFVKNPNFKTVINKLKKLGNKWGYTNFATITHGGAAMNAIWVLENKPACYFKFPKSKPGGGSIWDFAATACIFSEAGAFVSDIYGKPLDLNRPYSTFMNHRGIMYCSNNEIKNYLIHLYNSL